MTERHVCECCGVREADTSLSPLSAKLVPSYVGLVGARFANACWNACANSEMFAARIRKRREGLSAVIDAAESLESDESWCARQLAEYTGLPAHCVRKTRFGIDVTLDNGGLDSLMFRADLDHVQARDVAWFRAELAKCALWPRAVVSEAKTAKFYGTQPRPASGYVANGDTRYRGQSGRTHGPTRVAWQGMLQARE